MVNAIERPVIITKGWGVQLQWTYQYTDWVQLILIKESNLVEVSEYTITNGYQNEAVFHWWVSKVLKKLYRILEKVKARCWKPNKYKFGVEVLSYISKEKKKDD